MNLRVLPVVTLLVVCAAAFACVGPYSITEGDHGEEAWVRFENTRARPLYLYNLDSQGRWNWMATIEPGGNFSASTQVGQLWIATDTANQVVRQITAEPGSSSVKLN